jgi:hypothetical protein
VALVDVLRAAVSEIERYERVIPNIQPGISVRGQAVNDVVHLLSELAENATTFSPADAPVNVSGHLLNSGGALLDITDQGVGMDADEMAHANWRLDNPPVVDVAVSRRMGLFVVARLAARHGIRVRLRPAPMGLTALVWLPDEVITRETLPTPLGHPRFRQAENGAAAAPDGPADDADERSAAARAVAAARMARFEPHCPSRDEAPTDPGGIDGSQLAAAPTAEVMAPGHPADTANGAGPAVNGEAAATPPGVTVPPPAIVPEENRLPIFESVESDWFRRGRHGGDRTAAWPGPAPAAAGWSSPADEGWQAAEVAQAPVSSGTTRAGLPRRAPKANLVPGGVTTAATAPTAPRTAAQARQRLASFQQGIRDGRAAAPPEFGRPGDSGRECG